MPAQDLAVALIVLLCTGYAAWTLMPSVLRRALALRILKLSLPEAMARPFRKAIRPSSACGGCDSCGDITTQSSSSTVHKVTLHRPLR
jgi:hypothetical protein